jgi:hypothetical protein
MKRFYVQEKTRKLSEELHKLSRRQEQAARAGRKDPSLQKELNRRTDSLHKDFQALDSLNRSLKNPMRLPDLNPHFKAARLFQKQSLQQMKDSLPAQATRSQRKAAGKLDEMSRMMSEMMAQSQQEREKEDLNQIKSLIYNLLEVSFEEEKLLSRNLNNTYDYTQTLLDQNRLKNVLEKVSDTLYAIAGRQPAIGQDIFDAMHASLHSADKSLDFLQDTRYSLGKMYQHKMFEQVNRLIYLLNLFLDTKQNPSMAKGQGSGKKPSESQLPDMMKKKSGKIKQGMEELLRQMQQRKRQGNQGKPSAVYQLYKEQQQLKDLLRKFSTPEISDKIRKMNRELDELSKKMLRNGLNNELYKKFLELHYELLKLTRAAYQQQQDNKRVSRQPQRNFSVPDSVRMQLIRKYFPQIEHLKYFGIPLSKPYEEQYKQYKTRLQ